MLGFACVCSVAQARDRIEARIDDFVLVTDANAQSWLTAHYMLIGNPQRSRQTGAYLQALTDGRPIAEAVQAAYGLSIDELDREIRGYRNRGRIAGYRLRFNEPLPDANDVVIRPLPEAVALSRLAAAGIAVGRTSPDRIAERVERALQQKEPAADDDKMKTEAEVESEGELMDEAEDEDVVEPSISTGDERTQLSPEQSAMLQAARTAVLPFAGDPDSGISATLTVAGIDALLSDRKLEDTLALVQQSVAIYPSHAELALAEAGLCQKLGRNVAALASASRAARYTRSPELRRRIESWVQELEAEADSSR